MDTGAGGGGGSCVGVGVVIASCSCAGSGGAAFDFFSPFFVTFFFLGAAPSASVGEIVGSARGVNGGFCWIGASVGREEACSTGICGGRGGGGGGGGVKWVEPKIGDGAAGGVGGGERASCVDGGSAVNIGFGSGRRRPFPFGILGEEG